MIEITFSIPSGGDDDEGGGESATYPVHDPPRESAMPGLNSFCTFTGGARCGYGRFLMARKDYDAMKSAAGASGVVTLAMKDEKTTLTFNVLLAGALAHSIGRATDSGDIGDLPEDMLEVAVHDLRWKRTEPVRKAYNVQKDKPLDDSSLAFYDATLRSKSRWTWQQVLDDLAVFGSATRPSLPSWKPYNLIYRDVPANRVIDEVSSRLYWVVGWDYTSDAYTLWTPGQIKPSNDELMNLARLLSGGTTERNPARLPGWYAVTFRGYHPSVDDPFGQTPYVRSVANATGDSDVVQAFHVGDRVAVSTDSTGWIEQGDFDAVAAFVASTAAAGLAVDVGEYEFPGLQPFVLDGRVRGIRWVCDHEGARTVVRMNNDADFSPAIDAQRRAEAASNLMIVGAGSAVVGQAVGGMRLLWGAPPPGGLPPGGAKYQPLQKASDADFDVVWDWVRAHA